MADDRARVVVIGGGVAGASIAYHLAKLGGTDVLLVDRGELTSGSTFHSAGLVGQLRSSVSLTRMMMYGTDLYRTLAGRDGRGRVVARGGVAPARLLRGADAGAPAAGGLGPHLRPPAGDPLDRRGTRPLPAVRPRRRAGRRLPPHRRLPRPVRTHVRARRGREAARRRDPDGEPRDRDRRSRRPGPGRRHRGARADRGRRRRERRWDVREPARTDGRRGDSGRAVRPPVPPDGADRGRGGRICPRSATPTGSSTSGRRRAAGS